MRRIESRPVARRRCFLWRGRKLAWFVESIDEDGVWRRVFDVETGEVLDGLRFVG